MFRAKEKGRRDRPGTPGPTTEGCARPRGSTLTCAAFHGGAIRKTAPWVAKVGQAVNEDLLGL